MWSLRNKPPEELTDAERNVLSWAALMDFGWDFCLRLGPELAPEEDPLERLRRFQRRSSREHVRANERLLTRLGEIHGQ